MKLSIVIQYYNRKQLLINTLNSIIHTKTDLSDLEIIIIDDASNELHSIINIHSLFPQLDIKLYTFTSLEKWWHCPVIPINKGISMASGDVIMLLCAECMFVGDIISDILSKIKLNTYLVYSNLELSEQDTELLNHMTYEEICNNHPLNGSWYQHSQFHNRKLNFCTAIMRNDLLELGGFDERYGWGVDYGDNDFVLRLERKGIEFITIDKQFVYHQYHEKYIYTEFQSRVNYDNRQGRLVDQELYNHVVNNESGNIKVNNSFLCE